MQIHISRLDPTINPLILISFLDFSSKQRWFVIGVAFSQQGFLFLLLFRTFPSKMPKFITVIALYLTLVPAASSTATTAAASSRHAMSPRHEEFLLFTFLLLSLQEFLMCLQ
jgi:hypothetical protein